MITTIMFWAILLGFSQVRADVSDGMGDGIDHESAFVETVAVEANAEKRGFSDAFGLFTKGEPSDDSESDAEQSQIEEIIEDSTDVVDADNLVRDEVEEADDLEDGEDFSLENVKEKDLFVSEEETLLQEDEVGEPQVEQSQVEESQVETYDNQKILMNEQLEEEVIHDLLVELEEDDELSNESELIEYHCLKDLLKTGPHKSSNLFIWAKRLVRVGVGVGAATSMDSGLIYFAKDQSDKHGIIKAVGLASLTVSLYEYLAQYLPENQALYSSVLTKIVQNWNLYHLLIPEEYVDIFGTLHKDYVENGHQLMFTEKEAKHFVRQIKYAVKNEIEKREKK